MTTATNLATAASTYYLISARYGDDPRPTRWVTEAGWLADVPGDGWLFGRREAAERYILAFARNYPGWTLGVQSVG